VFDALGEVSPIAVGHGGRRLHARAAKGLHDRAPFGHGALARAHRGADALDQQVGGAGHGVEARLFQDPQGLVEAEAVPSAGVDQLGGGKGVEADAREGALDRPDEVRVLADAVVRVKPALEHHLRAARRGKLLHLPQDVVLSQRIGRDAPGPRMEGAEPAARLADIREIDDPVEDEAHPLLGEGHPAAQVAEAAQLDHIP
jgi:hypothetical protein